jgi:glycogen debranching enzyme
MPDSLRPLQPLMHEETVVLRAPTQAWSANDGSMGSAAIHGLYFSDVRILSEQTVAVGGQAGEHLATLADAADSVRFVALQRHLDEAGADPGIRSTQTRTATIGGVAETLLVESQLDTEIVTTVRVTLRAELSDLDHVKAGFGIASTPEVTVADGTTHWTNGAVTASLRAQDAMVSLDSSGEIVLDWDIRIPAHGTATINWAVSARDADAVVRGVERPASWSIPTIAAGDDRLGRWVTAALDDLDALRLSTVAEPDRVFLAAGAPWFFTLFGRDSLWAARFMLPLGTKLAGDTLRILARLQGRAEVADTAEQPGKIMHELRRGTLSIPGEDISLPPLYYGTIDATALWVNLLHDAWKWGLPDDEVRALLPNLVAALEWMRDFGDADGDGLLEYVDETGRGLTNQGWKDSGDSVQWKDGQLAEGPIALCEVQAYAYEAATHGAELFDHFGLDGASEWRSWASRLQARFNETFWIEDAAGDYPAIALDAHKRAVDTVTSNLGHLLGTGLLDERQAALVARRLSSPELNSGYGLRTMSTDAAGYWPLSYHGGSVWAHDTAIAISGLAHDGFAEEATALSAGLLAAASGFHYRMPELHSGDPAALFPTPIPYPAACRPQAWSAAAAISVLSSALGLRPDAASGTLSVSPSTTFGALRLEGLRLGTADVSLTVNADGEVTAASGAHIEVR